MEMKFVSYDGEYPNLCSGVLTLEIDGETVRFGGFGGSDDMLPRFWSTGGSVRFDDGWMEHVDKAPWTLEATSLPEWLRPHGKQLIDLFNENVPDGCCGGCV